MRLSPEEIAAIIQCAVRHFGPDAKVRLFGSRTSAHPPARRRERPDTARDLRRALPRRPARAAGGAVAGPRVRPAARPGARRPRLRESLPRREGGAKPRRTARRSLCADHPRRGAATRTGSRPQDHVDSLDGPCSGIKGCPAPWVRRRRSCGEPPPGRPQGRRKDWRIVGSCEREPAEMLLGTLRSSYAKGTDMSIPASSSAPS